MKIYSLPIPTTQRTRVMARCLYACLRDHPSHTLSKTHKGLREKRIGMVEVVSRQNTLDTWGGWIAKYSTQ